ncbi:hypothetical protein [Paraburkholderia sp. J63]|uniref:hypothetical protein n=1 Tax=Paraburkholderia sp. J63 TaxID=2805434 RepID=UPI002ABD8E7E|nr:hypothetical protein [Paraburkholderia sp. J63]
MKSPGLALNMHVTIASLLPRFHCGLAAVSFPKSGQDRAVAAARAFAPRAAIYFASATVSVANTEFF